MILMPPRHGKSIYSSILFVPWWFAQHPETAVIAASHTYDLAEEFGRTVRNLVDQHGNTLGYTLRPDSKAAGRWHTNKGGQYIAAGTNKAISGRPADLGIIDDPVEDREAANSESIREHVWNWYRSDFYTRLQPGARLILIMTRWHMEDLGGKLLEEQEIGGDTWTILRLPAIAPSPLTADGKVNPEYFGPDLLGRSPGEALWPEWRPLEQLARIKAVISEADWWSLFQQMPRAPAGVLFEVDKIDTRDRPDPSPRSQVRAWDLASTEEIGSSDPDWTRGIKLQRTRDDHYIVTDMKSRRGLPKDIEDLIVETAERDGPSVPILLPQDPGQAGKSQIEYFQTKLTGYRLIVKRPTGSKETRASNVISQCSADNLSMVRGVWNKIFIEELRDFPQGKHDDIVDALSDAFNEIGVTAPPISVTMDAIQRMQKRLVLSR